MDKVYDLIFNEENPSWESIIYRLVRDGKIDPWDIDVSVLTKEYLKMIGNLENFNFRISGKVILAASILLKLKSKDLGVKEFVSMTEENPQEEVYSIDFPEVAHEEPFSGEQDVEDPHVDVKVPRLRRRKVTINELTSALRKAIEVEERREERKKQDMKEIHQRRQKVKRRKKGINIFKKIKEVYNRVTIFIKDKKGDNAELTDILPSQKKEDIIWTFVPLLYLSSSGKIKMEQKESFGPIRVSLNKNGRHKK